MFCLQLIVKGRDKYGGGLYNGRDETPNEPHTAIWAEIAADWLLQKGYDSSNF